MRAPWVAWSTLGLTVALLAAPALAQQPPPIAPPPIPLPPAQGAPPPPAPPPPAAPPAAAPLPPPPAAPLPPPPAPPLPPAPPPARPAAPLPPPPAAPLPPPPPAQVAPLPPALPPPPAALPPAAPQAVPAQALPPPALPSAPTPTAAAPAAAPSAPTKDLWYRPTPLDDDLPWNKHNPWGGWSDPQARGAFHLTLTTASHFFQSGLKGTGGEVGVRLGAPAIGLAIGKYLPDGRNVVGLDLFPNYGKILYDTLIPDVQVGLLMPSVGLRYIWGAKDMKAGAVQVGVLGARCTIEDFVQIDARPIVGVWGGEEKIAISVGVSLDAGIAF